MNVASPNAGYVRIDWRQRTKTVVPEYAQERGRWTGSLREDIAQATKRAFDGILVCLFRMRDDLTTIEIRHQEDDRRNISNLQFLEVQPILSTDPVPLLQAWLSDGTFSTMDVSETGVCAGYPVSGSLTEV